MDDSIQLLEAAFDAAARRPAGFPFNLPSLKEMTSLDFRTPVTFLVGENGSGKSTFLEALAAATNLPTVGSEAVSTDPSLVDQRRLARHLKLSWARRSHRGFFLRAEDFFGFARRLARMRQEFEAEIREVDEKFQDHSELARMLAKNPARRSIAEIESRYGTDLDANSHGESFLKLFRSRFVPDGLYLLDEPEAALSPQSQLAFLAMLRDMVGERAQFVIATHSPILMALPGAVIYSFDHHPARPVPYGDLEAVNLTRDFLNAPERYLRHLWG